MIYLDHAASTQASKEVLESFQKTCINYPGNTNSYHKLGIESKNLMDTATKQIADLLKVKTSEIIYTSSSSESNNLAIKGIALKYQNRGKHIITTGLEHSSIYGPLNYLQTIGFEVEFVEIDENGKVNIKDLENKLRDDTILVSICSVNSELGVIQPIEEIAKKIKEHPKCFFHSDMTGSMGKINIPIENIDLITFSPHKFHGLTGTGCLIKKENIELVPLIHGGKSTTIYRSGTPALPLIVAFAKALRIALENLEQNYEHVQTINKYVRQELNKIDGITINTPNDSVPFVLNFSIEGVKPETFVHALEEEEIYISTQTACSIKGTMSQAIYNLTKDEERAKRSIRISFDGSTTKEEIDIFLNSLKNNYRKLKLKS